MFTVPPGSFEGYIFDCDGTLADTMPVHYNGFLHAFGKHGAPFHFDEEDFYSWGGVALREVVERLNRKHGASVDPDAIFETKNAYMEAHAMDARPVEPVVAFARQVAAERKPVAVASGGHRDEVLRTLRAIGVEDLFPVVVTRSEVTHGKPHPETYLRAAEQLGVAPERCLVFEDATPGVESARAAGMEVVFVETRKRV
jgi:HAD superfamily hydrolase (TIGR01509 family)